MSRDFWTFSGIPVPALEAPLDLKPRTATLRLTVAGNGPLTGAVLKVILDGVPREISIRNNALTLP